MIIWDMLSAVPIRQLVNFFDAFFVLLTNELLLKRFESNL